jgi:hypothetical protein
MAAKDPMSQKPQAEADPAQVAKVKKIIKSGGATVEAIIASLTKKCGGLAIPALVFRTIKGPDKEAVKRQRPQQRAENLLRSALTFLGNVDARRQLALKDRRAYRESLKDYLRMVRVLINGLCDVEAHRPIKDGRRNDLVVRIKLAEGGGFRQVAERYQEKTGQPMNANVAERIWARRNERDAERLIRLLRPELSLDTEYKCLVAKDAGRAR